jgi:acyl transferase domain-containing protein
VCGVIKMILALRHELLPRSLHLDRPSSQVDWDRGGVALLTEAMPWPRGERPRRAGVSSFGISGTNAHVILEEAPHEPAATPTRVPGSAVAEPLPWLLSAAHPRALQAQAHRLGERLAADSALRVHDVGVTLLRGRSRHENRAVLLGPTRDSLVGGLRALAANRRHDQVVRGRATSSGTTAMLFAGQGAQRLGMGTALAARHPVFRQTFETVAAHFDGPLTEVVDGEDAAVLDRTEWAQPALFSFEVALARLAESYGLLPDHLLGHSIGEVAAAHVAGVFSLADACRLVHARGQLMQALPSGGAMVAIEATEAEVSPLLGERADLAAINTPHSLVVSGDEDAVVGIAEVFAERGRRTRRLPVSHAFHSHRMEPMLDAFKEALASITYHSPRIPLISCTTGRPVSEEVRSPAYWADHVRRTVRFADGLATLRADGATRFVELGPDAILSAFVDSDAQDIVAVPLLRGRQEDEPEAFTRALASLHAAGVEIDWSSRFPGDARLVELPTYPFQPRRYWPQAPVTAVADDDLIAALDRDDLAGAVELLRPRDSGEHAALVTALPLLVAWRHRRHATQDQHQHSDVEWRAVLSGDRPAEPLSGDPWLVLGRRRAVLEDALRRGGALVLDTVSDSTGVGNAGEPRADVARLAAVLAHAHGTTPLAGVLWAPSGHDLTELPALLRLLVAAPTAARLWVATTRAVRVPGDDQPPDPDAAMLWEAGRAAGLEHPTNWGGLVDFPATDDIDPARLAVLTDPNTSEVALRGAMVHVRRLPRGLVQEDGQPASGGGGRLVDQLAGLAAAEQEALLLDFLFEQFALVLGQSRADVVRPDTAFKDAGFDSLAVVELRDQLREVTGLKLPATVFFDHPTPLAFVRHLRDELAPDGVSPAAPVLDALAGLESPIGAAASEDDARDRIIKRLRELVKAAQAAAGQGASDDDLDAASDEELFALVDRSA